MTKRREQMCAAAAAEARSLWRMPRYWLLSALVVATGVGAYYVLARLHADNSPYSSTAGLASPRFLVHVFGTAPLCVLLFGVVLLAFDHRHRDARCGIAETLDARPLSNLAFLAGRCAALVATAALALLLTLAAIQAWGVAARTFDWTVGEPLEPISLASFVVVDALPALVAWCALALLLAAALRNRALVALTATGLLAGHYWLLHNTPVHLLPAVSLLPGFGTFASDVLPHFASPWVLAQRILVLVLAGGLLAITATMHPRADNAPATRLACAVSGAALVAVALAGVALLALRSAGELALRERWLAAQRTVDAVPRADVERIEGRVGIDPGRSLALDIEMTMTAPDPTPAELVFGFNPGMAVHELLIDGEAARHRHESGLLFVRPRRPLAPAAEFALSLRGAGVPDPRFAYLDGGVEPLAESWASSLLPYLGTEASIFDDAYVALMPGARWLPMPGPNLAADPALRPRDFFTIDLEVEAPSGWHVAAPGRRRPTGTPNRLRFRPGAPLAEVPVVAAPFERYAIDVGGIEFELLLHPAHTRNAERIADAGLGGELARQLAEFVEEARGFGIPYPYDGLSVVEAPAPLRVYGGGRRMASVQNGPGVLFMREHGFPTARVDRYSNILDSPRFPALTKMSPVRGYFDRDRAGGNLLSGATDNLLPLLTEARGAASDAASLLLARLTSRLFWIRHTPFSALAFTETSLSATSAAANADSLAVRLATLASGNAARIVGAAEWDLDHSSIWERATLPAEAGSAPGYDAHHDLATMSRRSDAVAFALRFSLGREGTGSLLAAVRRRHEGGTFTLEDVEAAAVSVGTPMAPIIKDWLFGRSAPRFTASPAEVRRLADDESGKARYQITARVRNEGAAMGVVLLEVGSARDYASVALHREWSDLVPVPGHSAVEVGMLSARPPLEAWLLTFLSLNRADMRLELAEANDERKLRDEPPAVGARSSSWRTPSEAGIIVDDLDRGFSVESSPTQGLVPRLSTYFGTDRQRDARHLDQGIPAYRHAGWAWPFLPTGGTSRPRWTRQPLGSAWGKYRRTLVRAASGDGLLQATFSAHLPTSGRWRLGYHLPNMSRVLRSDSMTRSRRSALTWNGGPPGTYHLALTAHGEETAIEFDASGAVPGWNTVDTFALEAGEVRLTVSNRSSGETVVADAIRWRRVEPHLSASEPVDSQEHQEPEKSQ